MCCCRNLQPSLLLPPQGSKSYPYSPMPRCRRWRFHYSVDVLTDGSENTGNATLFLSVYRNRFESSKRREDFICFQDEAELGEVMARYALGGVGDCTSRLAADQRYKLKNVKAAFFPSTDARRMVGIASLLFALREAGAPSLSVVTPHMKNKNTANDLMQVLVSRNFAHHPKILLCEVPASSSGGTKDDGKVDGKINEKVDAIWWQVYQDEFLSVHAHTLPDHTQRPCNRETVFLYTLTPNNTDINQTTHPTFSFLVSPLASVITRELIENLPLLAIENSNRTVALKCSFVIVEGPQQHNFASVITKIYWLQPNLGTDSQLLVRGWHQSLLWNRRLPLFFPIRSEDSSVDKQGGTNELTKRLTTASRLVWGQDIGSKKEELVWSWSHPSLQRPRSLPTVTSDHDHIAPGVTGALERFLAKPSWIASTDDNEIELDDSEEGENDEIVTCTGTDMGNKSEDDGTASVARLLVLGTGSAAPSPYRGASGHVLMGAPSAESPVPWAIAFEAGEGFVTQWYRHAPQHTQDIGVISVIWISHAHWDHYGGLVPLLLAIASSNDAAEKLTLPVTSSSSKKRRLTNQPVPIVFAPRRVLEFLFVFWPDNHHTFFRGVAHEEPRDCIAAVWSDWNKRFTQGPVDFWENILVDHSCCNSYGFVMGLRSGRGSIPYILAFSGDTRPCPRFVRVCQQYGAVDFLIHEATFDEGQREMSIQKKHSTIQEALSVANQVNANRTLLTHFSQRYNNKKSWGNDMTEQALHPVAMAVDGMLVPLWSSPSH